MYSKVYMGCLSWCYHICGKGNYLIFPFSEKSEFRPLVTNLHVSSCYQWLQDYESQNPSKSPTMMFLRQCSHISMTVGRLQWGLERIDSQAADIIPNALQLIKGKIAEWQSRNFELFCWRTRNCDDYIRGIWDIRHTVWRYTWPLLSNLHVSCILQKIQSPTVTFSSREVHFPRIPNCSLSMR